MAVIDIPVLANACYTVTCDRCGKTTWRGCGMHVQAVMAKVKEEDKCVCKA